MSKVAYGLYNYSASGDQGIVGVASYASGEITVGARVSVSSGDTKVFGYKNPQKAVRLMVAQCVWENQVAQPMLLTSYDENLNTVGNLKNTSVSGHDAKGNSLVLKNAYAMAPNSCYYGLGGAYGQMLCFIDYDASAVIAVPVKGDDAKPTQAVGYTYTPESGESGYGIDVTTDGKVLYALFISAASVWTGDYSKYTVVRMSDDFDTVVSKDVKTYNPFSLQLYDDNLYIVSVGGMQNYGSSNGANSKIELLSSDFSADTAIKTLLVGGTTAEEGDFRSLAFSSDGADAYVLTGFYNADGSAFNGALHYTDMDTLAEADGKKITDVEVKKSATIENVEGYTWGLLYSETDSAVWMAKGNELAVYAYSDEAKAVTQIASITAKNLAGSGNGYNLNSFTLVGEGKNFKGAVHPAFASLSKVALEKKKELLKR